MAGENKPRIFTDGRDMLINVALIIVAMLAVVGFTGLCSFNPGAPEQGPVQEVDARAFIDLESRAVDFPVRYPEVPAEWVANSARRTMVGGAPAPVIGWVTPAGSYLQLTQTAASLDDAISAVDPTPRELARTEAISGHDAEVYAAPGVRDIWAVDAGQRRLVATGAATDEEFRELIAAAL
ncbi:DUF4245 domain-containing protein [Corynebacterium liangguodongii]|uniref:DUF4245 domain-containing protein n=1 Tax=Corynebacterium liangguodongii TaxID=2079535 RepID=A0A2S0WD92_9CORY|nr:DUF4245 domain-containing protein [Corynebacterium liangguodongii]AWB83739.1 DUF4245 domain-containing protein [Corynebacterium liangguodongii]PWB99451.1 DUF4245 domain-containing protein [Corynebacterium liangguodongii]